MSVVSPLPPPRGPVRLQRLRILFALVVREMGTKFGRSYGGYFWSVAEPLGGIVLLTIAFSVALRSPPLGTNFAIFYATGIIPFFLFLSVVNGVANAVMTNRGLLRYPIVTPLDTVFGKFILEFVTMFIVGVLLYSGIILYFGLMLNLELSSALMAFLMAGVLGLGIGTLNCVLFGFFPTFRNIWNIVTKPLFIISGMFYTFETLPEFAQNVLWYNPLIHIVGLMRSGFYGTYEASYVSFAYVFGIATVCFVVGSYLLRRHASHLIEMPAV